MEADARKSFAPCAPDECKQHVRDVLPGTPAGRLRDAFQYGTETKGLQEQCRGCATPVDTVRTTAAPVKLRPSTETGVPSWWRQPRSTSALFRHHAKPPRAVKGTGDWSRVRHRYKMSMGRSSPNRTPPP